MVKTEDVQNTKIKYVVDYNLVTFEAQDSICFNIAVDSISIYITEKFHCLSQVKGITRFAFPALLFPLRLNL